MLSQTNTSTIESGQYLNKVRLENLLRRITPAPAQPVASVYVQQGDIEPFLQSNESSGQEWWSHLSELGDPVLKSDTGIVGLRSGDKGLAIIPPFPVLQSSLSAEWNVEPLLEILKAQYTVGVVLLRLGRYSVAVYRGEQLVSSKTDSRYVKGKHHAGGTSQLRFQRIREGQMRKIYDKTCLVVRTQFTPYSANLDYVMLGGERFTLNGFLKVCPFMQQYLPITLSRRLNVRDPKRDTLEDVGNMLWESRLYPFQW